MSYTQLVNILKGDMSVVGNRPLPLYEAERPDKRWKYRTLHGACRADRLVAGGKTGDAGKLSAKERKELDLKYGKEFSLFSGYENPVQDFDSFCPKKEMFK